MYGQVPRDWSVDGKGIVEGSLGTVAGERPTSASSTTTGGTEPVPPQTPSLLAVCLGRFTMSLFCSNQTCCVSCLTSHSPLPYKISLFRVEGQCLRVCLGLLSGSPRRPKGRRSDATRASPPAPKDLVGVPRRPREPHRGPRDQPGAGPSPQTRTLNPPYLLRREGRGPVGWRLQRDPGSTGRGPTAVEDL